MAIVCSSERWLDNKCVHVSVLLMGPVWMHVYVHVCSKAALH